MPRYQTHTRVFVAYSHLNVIEAPDEAAADAQARHEAIEAFDDMKTELRRSDILEVTLQEIEEVR